MLSWTLGYRNITTKVNGMNLLSRGKFWQKMTWLQFARQSWKLFCDYTGLINSKPVLSNILIINKTGRSMYKGKHETGDSYLYAVMDKYEINLLGQRVGWTVILALYKVIACSYIIIFAKAY